MRLSHAFNWRHPQQGIDRILHAGFFKKRLNHGGLDGARGHRINTDAIASIVKRIFTHPVCESPFPCHVFHAGFLFRDFQRGGFVTFQ